MVLVEASEGDVWFPSPALPVNFFFWMGLVLVCLILSSLLLFLFLCEARLSETRRNQHGLNHSKYLHEISLVNGGDSLAYKVLV